MQSISFKKDVTSLHKHLHMMTVMKRCDNLTLPLKHVSKIHVWIRRASPKRCTGRGLKSTKRQVRPSAPIINPAREGHFTPNLCQPSLSIRLETKQVRRLQSLESQLHAGARRGLAYLNESCTTLWESIVHANGFHPSFTEFVLGNLGMSIIWSVSSKHMSSRLQLKLPRFRDFSVSAES